MVEQGFLGALGCDTDTKLTAACAAKLVAGGMKFVLRYLSLGSPAPGDLDKTEVDAILSANLSLMAVQHVRSPGWMPTGQLGGQDGSSAAHNAVVAGIPAGVTIWLDLEGVSSVSPAQSVIDYVRSWYTAVRASGYDCGLYVGSGVPLDGAQLYSLPVDRYWRSFSEVPNVNRRGYCMIQLYDTTKIGGIDVDLDVIQSDYLGGLPRWLAPAPAAPLATAPAGACSPDGAA